MPEIDISVRRTDGSEQNFYLVNYFGNSPIAYPQQAFVFDQYGDIRWYLDYQNHPVLYRLFFDNGLIRLNNGNFIFGDNFSSSLYEVDYFGKVINTWGLHGYRFHAAVLEKPNGNFLVTVDDPQKVTVQDVILEINRNNGAIVNSWDLTESLDQSRHVWLSNRSNLRIDWFHANGLGYSAEDNSIIVSGRTQGVVKLNHNNDVAWILAPHLGWSTSGNGTDLTQFLLKPLDGQNNIISDMSIFQGYTNHSDFEWSWYQHSPILMSNGNLLLFDNGENRNYSLDHQYSRTVEYAIDENEKTLKQIWSYGKSRGEETYSQVVSRADILDNGNVLFTPGPIQTNGIGLSRVIEVNPSNNQVEFEEIITPPGTLANITFHNVHQIELSIN